MDPRTLDAQARHTGHCCWVEMRAFELLGAWSASVPEPEVKAMVATHSRQRAWHAELWHDLLPTAGDGGIEGFITPANPGVEAFVEALAQPEAPERTIEKLAGAYRVLTPRTVAAYTEQLADASPITDGPAIRALRLVLADQVEHWREGEAMLQALLRSGRDVDRAAGHQARLEALLVEAGGLLGTGR